MNKPVNPAQLDLEGPRPTPAPADIPVKKASPPLVAEEDRSDAFNWDDPNEDAIVLREQRATAVYRNKSDEVVIRQKGPWPDEDVFIYLSPENEVAFMDGMAEKLRK